MAEGKQIPRREFLKRAGMTAAAAGMGGGAWLLFEGLGKLEEYSEQQRLDRAKRMLQDARYILENNPNLSFAEIKSLNDVTVLRNGVEVKLRTAGHETKPPEDVPLKFEFPGDDHTVWLYARSDKGTNIYPLAPFSYFDVDTPVTVDMRAIEKAHHLDPRSLTTSEN